jgi:hypothetical protein
VAQAARAVAEKEEVVVAVEEVEEVGLWAALPTVLLHLTIAIGRLADTAIRRVSLCSIWVTLFPTPLHSFVRTACQRIRQTLHRVVNFTRAVTRGQHKADSRAAITRIPVEDGTNAASEQRPVKRPHVDPPRQLEWLNRKQAAHRQKARQPPAKPSDAFGQAVAQSVSKSLV